MDRNLRLPALRRFAAAITVLTVLGHLLLGFEQSWAQVVVALACAYATELVLELVHAVAERRPPRLGRSPRDVLEFFLSAHITGLAVAMLLYAHHSLWPFAFASVVGIASKSIFRVRVDGGSRHFLNPSNTGIVATLLLFPWVGIAPPYQFTENLYGGWDWFLPALFVCVGTFLNTRFTRRLPLVLGWVGGFFVQAVVRSWLFGTPLAIAVLPMTGVAFLLYTFYMVPDPGTTPNRRWQQVAFGSAVALIYGVLMSLHVVFGLFFALAIVCTGRGFLLWAASRWRARAEVEAPASARFDPASAAEPLVAMVPAAEAVRAAVGRGSRPEGPTLP
jgi:hypothetical protein